MANPFTDFLFGKTNVDAKSTLTGGQKGLLNALTSGGQQAVGDLYGTLGGLSQDAPDAYQGIPDFEQQFQQQYGDPLQQQYEQDLAGIQHSGELFSGGTTANNYRAMRNLNTNLASARAGMMMQERAKQQQSLENSYKRQLQASQLLSGLSTQGLGVRAKENIVSKDPGVLSIISGVGSAVGSVAQGISGLGGLGGGGGGQQNLNLPSVM